MGMLSPLIRRKWRKISLGLVERKFDQNLSRKDTFRGLVDSSFRHFSDGTDNGHFLERELVDND